MVSWFDLISTIFYSLLLLIGVLSLKRQKQSGLGQIL